MEWLLWLVLGIVIGWLTDYFVLRRWFGDEASSLKQELATSRSEQSALQTQLRTASAESTNLRAQLDRATGAEASLQAELGTLNTRAADWDAERADLSARVATLSAAADRNAALEAQLADCRAALADAQAQVAAVSEELEDVSEELEEVVTEYEEETTTMAHAEADPGEPDDLKRIEGIGPKISRILNEAGIYTFAQLATRSADTLQQILTDAGISRISDPTTWPEQARYAAEGDWDGLQTLQDNLKGGRR